MKLILHIGDIKTGTSAIQQHFHAHKDAYLKFGLQYINDEKRTDFRSLSSAINTEDRAVLGVGLSSFSKLGPIRRVEFVRSVLTEALRHHWHWDTGLISSEHLFYSLRTLNHIRQLKQLLSDFFSEFQIVVYLRHPVDSFRSSYSTHLKSGGTLSAPLFLNKKFLPRANHAQRLDYWAQMFGKQNVSLRVYANEAFIGGSLEADFFAACGLAIPLVEPFMVKNKTLGAEAAAKLRLLNFFIPERLRRTEWFCLRWDALVAEWSELEGPSIKVRESLQLRIESEYNTLNKGILRSWGDGDDNLALLFAKDKTIAG